MRMRRLSARKVSGGNSDDGVSACFATRKYLPEQVVEVKSGEEFYYCMILEAEEMENDCALLIDYIGGKR
jgi:hypothetical protein